MDSRTRTVNRLVKSYDEALMARRDGKGVIHVYRKKPRAACFEHNGIQYVHVFNVDDYIFSLTDTWKHEGRPVERGLEPIWQKISELDSWRDDTGYDEFAKRRERAEADKKRMRRNEFRARAADARRDFAKATNDIVVRQEALDKNKNY